MSNPLGWPDIKHLPDYFRSLWEAHVRYREDPECDDSTVRAPLSLEKLNELIFTGSWVANIKYDGTNVAIARSGQIYGRRRRVEGTSYQKCDVTFLKENQVAALADDILGNMNEEVSKFFVYGELVINDKYDYSKLNIFRKWLAFGICMEIPNSEKGLVIHDRLIKAGFRCNSLHKVIEGQMVKITILLNDKLRKVLEKYNISTAETLFEGGCLYELITKCGDWMLNGNGEGLVCVANEFQKKWKIGMEVQPSIFEHFRDILEKISSYDDMDPRIIDAAKIMFDVKESDKLMGVCVTKRKSKKPRKEKPESIFPPEQMKGAIESALTKYDSLESYFVANNMKEIVSLIVEETKNDLMPTIDDSVIQQNAIKEINNFVRKYVGIRYGMWKGQQD